MKSGVTATAVQDDKRLPGRDTNGERAFGAVRRVGVGGHTPLLFQLPADGIESGVSPVPRQPPQSKTQSGFERDTNWTRAFGFVSYEPPGT